jgi:prophage regulatory protein
MEMQTSPTSSRVLRMRGTTEKVGLCPSLIYALVARGDFPRPILLVPGGRAVGWLEGDLDLWLAERKGASERSQSTEASQVRGESCKGGVA